VNALRLAVALSLTLQPLLAFAQDEGGVSLLNPSFILQAIIILLLVVVVVFVIRMHNAGVSNADLPKQVELKGEALVDTARDKLVAFLIAELPKLPPSVLQNSVVAAIKAEAERASANMTLKDAYFDRDELVADITRMPATFNATVYLDDVLKHEGTGQEIRYYTQPKVPFNVTKTKPPAPPAPTANVGTASTA